MHILDLCKTINTKLDAEEVLDTARLVLVFQIIYTLLGLRESKEEVLPQEVIVLAEKRKQARLDKDFALSDSLRDELFSLGYKVEDSASGQVVSKK